MESGFSPDPERISTPWRDRVYTTGQLAEMLHVPVEVLHNVACVQIGAPRRGSGADAVYAAPYVVEWLLSTDVYHLVDDARRHLDSAA